MNPEQSSPTPVPIPEQPAGGAAAPIASKAKARRNYVLVNFLVMLGYLALSAVLTIPLLLSQSLGGGFFNGNVSIFVFWHGAGIHTAAILVWLIVCLFRKDWKASGELGLSLLMVPLLSCGFCLGGLGLLGSGY